MWKEENGGKLTPSNDAAGDMRSMGITPGGMSADMADQSAEAPPDMAAEAEPGAEEGAQPMPGGAAGAPPPPA